MPMKIQGGQGGAQRPERTREVSTQPVEPRERRDKRTPSQVEKYDRVEISDAVVGEVARRIIDRGDV
jgi:hypothetical protein